MAVRNQDRPPWLEDGQPERWVTVEQFARLVMRSPKTVYRWCAMGNVLPAFKYRAYRDPLGRWRIQISPEDLAVLGKFSSFS